MRNSVNFLDNFHQYTIKCNFCGYSRVLSSKTDVEIFVALHAIKPPMMDEWKRNVLLLERSLADFKKKTRERRETERREKAVKAVTPTKAQKRRGATHPVNCTVCGTITFRRKKEWEQRKVAYCSPKCQKQGTLTGPSQSVVS